MLSYALCPAFASRPLPALSASRSRSASITISMLPSSSWSTSLVSNQASTYLMCHCLGSEAETEAQYIGIIVTPSAPLCLGIDAECGSHSGNLVGGDADPGPCPTEEHALVTLAGGNFLGHTQSDTSPLRGVARFKCSVELNVHPSLRKQSADPFGDRRTFIAPNGQPHRAPW